MTFTEERKKYILEQFLSIISCISDKEYQKRVWIKGEGPEVDDFDETSCHFFDDGDPILEKYKDYKIKTEQYRLLVELRNSFSSFVDGPHPYLPEEFIDTPEWARIMNLAKEVLKAFNYTKKP